MVSLEVSLLNVQSNDDSKIKFNDLVSRSILDVVSIGLEKEAFMLLLVCADFVGVS